MSVFTQDQLAVLEKALNTYEQLEDLAGPVGASHIAAKAYEAKGHNFKPEQVQDSFAVIRATVVDQIDFDVEVKTAIKLGGELTSVAIGNARSDCAPSATIEDYFDEIPDGDDLDPEGELSSLCEIFNVDDPEEAGELALKEVLKAQERAD